jgi:TATA-box binding protein (TBP) (component of TFIID and TFIIIB)
MFFQNGLLKTRSFKKRKRVKTKKRKDKKPKLTITNIVVNGKMPFERSLNFNEIEKLIEKGIFEWSIINQETSPMLIATVRLEGFNKSNKQRKATMTLWHSGSFNLTGVKKRKEITECYEKILDELTKLAPRVFERRLK